MFKLRVTSSVYRPWQKNKKVMLSQGDRAVMYVFWNGVRNDRTDSWFRFH